MAGRRVRRSGLVVPDDVNRARDAGVVITDNLLTHIYQFIIGKIGIFSGEMEEIFFDCFLILGSRRDDPGIDDAAVFV